MKRYGKRGTNNVTREGEKGYNPIQTMYFVKVSVVQHARIHLSVKMDVSTTK